ncbi:unnamed protein product [Arabidopsis halleri]
MDLFERSFVIKFLFGLNDSYENIRESIIMLDPLPDLEKTFNIVIQREHQQNLKQSPQSGSVVYQMSSRLFKILGLILVHLIIGHRHLLSR